MTKRRRLKKKKSKKQCKEMQTTYFSKTPPKHQIWREVEKNHPPKGKIILKENSARLTILSRSSSTMSMIWANSLSDPPMTISSSVWLLPMHSNLKRCRLLLRFLLAFDKSAGTERHTLHTDNLKQKTYGRTHRVNSANLLVMKYKRWYNLSKSVMHWSLWDQPAEGTVLEIAITFPLIQKDF